MDGMGWVEECWWLRSEDAEWKVVGSDVAGCGVRGGLYTICGEDLLRCDIGVFEKDAGCYSIVLRARWHLFL